MRRDHDDERIVGARRAVPPRHRRSIRLKDYDYSQAGVYFITVCTRDRECLFGKIVDGDMRLNDYGRVASDEWLGTAMLRPYVMLDYFVVMPNHLHAIIILIRNVGATRRVARTNELPRGDAHTNGPVSGSIGAIIGQFKSAVTKRVNAMRGTSGIPIWQRNYYERIIRDAGEMHRIREYIANNPAHWPADDNNPDIVGSRRAVS